MVKVGWKYEGVGWYSDKSKTIPLYRAYNPNARAGSHNYTVNKSEQNHLIKVGWKNEGISWYGSNKSTTPPAVTKYTVTVKHVGSDGKTLKTATAQVEKGKSYTAKAESFSGYTLKGSNSQTVTVNGNKTITFNYTKNSNPSVQNYTVTVKHINKQTNESLGTSTDTIKSGDNYTAHAKPFKYNDNTVTTEQQFSYQVIGESSQTKKITANTTINFYYDQVHQIYVYAQNRNSNSLISNVNERNVINVTHGKNTTITAPTFNSYVLDTRRNTQNTINLNNVTESKRIDFYYCKQFDVKTNHVDADTNAVIHSESKRVLEGENYTANWNQNLVSQNYLLCGENIQSGSRSVSNVSKNETLTFKYKNISLDQLNAQVAAQELSVLNQYRQQNGVGSMQTHSVVQEAANIRAKELKTSPGHHRPGGGTAQDLLESLGCYGYTGENIYRSSLYADTLYASGGSNIINTWKDSYGHNANLLYGNQVIAGFGNYFEVDPSSGALNVYSIFLGSRNVFA